MYCIVGLQTSLFMLILLCIILRIMKFFLKDFYETVQARVVIFGMQVNNDVLYHEIVNQSSHSFSSLYLSDFLSFHTLNNEVFRERFL